LEGAKGVKGKRLFAFFQWPLVCEIQYVLRGEENLRLAILIQKGRACHSSRVWIWLDGSGLLVPSTGKSPRGMKRIKLGTMEQSILIVLEGKDGA